MDTTKLIETFYMGLREGNGDKMIACYHDDVVFEDPAFGKLKSNDAKKMWLMLCEKGKETKIEFSQIEANEVSGSAHWEAWYNFSQTGRPVHNIIDAKFEFKNGKIIKHIDYFNLHRWASQAMGWKGKILGGTNFFKKKLHQQTKATLHKFKA